MDGAGKYTALTPKLRANLLAQLAVGDFPQMAAYRAGCSPQTLHKWLCQGCDPVGVEPYVSFTAEFIKVEADLSARLMGVVMDHAMGVENAGNADHCKWLLLNRFQFLWKVDKESGRIGGISVSEVVERHLLEASASRREQAKAIIARLPEEAKQSARKGGFLV